jgi:hypothetical protein
VALFELKDFSKAGEAFIRAKELGASDADCWLTKCESESEGVISTPCNSNDEKTSVSPATESTRTEKIDRDEKSSPEAVIAPTLASKVRDSFYDNKAYVSYTIYAKSLKPTDVDVDFLDEKRVGYTVL